MPADPRLLALPALRELAEEQAREHFDAVRDALRTADAMDADAEDCPALHLAGWNSGRTAGHHGPGPKLSIMLYTPHHYRVDGLVYLLAPQTDREVALLAELIRCRRAKLPIPPATLAEYRGSLESRWAKLLGAGMLSPHRLALYHGGGETPVPPGASLLCTCSVAHSQAGECHRAWVAPFLHRAGWRVVLDGVEQEDPTDAR